MKKRLIIFSLLFIILLTSGFGCVNKPPAAATKPIILNYWRVFDGPDAFDGIIANYNKLHANITIKYSKFRYSEFESELLNALAEDRGPDIISIRSSWLKKYQSKLAPMPDAITMGYPVTTGTIQKQTTYQLRTVKSLTLRELKDNFADVVFDNVAMNVMDDKSKSLVQRVYGLPLFLDTLAMYYNKDLLNNAGIAYPPAYWNKEFQEDVKKLTKQDDKGQIVQAGVAVGASKNIERYSDILSVLMMQNGTVMMDDAGNVAFNTIPEAFRSQNLNPGAEALRFYTDFSNPAKEVYSWNKDQDSALNMFMAGKLAFMFDYSYDLPVIRAQSPKLNFSVAKLPQIEGNPQQINYADYWVESVMEKSKNVNEAWDFVQFETKAEQAKLYLDKTKRPAALKSLISSQLDDMDLGVFAGQVLTAKNWYKGMDPDQAEKFMGEMVDSMVLGQDTEENIMNLAASKIQQTVNIQN